MRKHQSKRGGARSHLDVGRVPLAAPPRVDDPGEGSIRVVKLILVSIQVESCKGLLINKPQIFLSFLITDDEHRGCHDDY